jgi:undecaprenyl diphosphate synthase
MDGNGRWAKKRLMPRNMGHRAGMSALKTTVKTCDEFHIPYLTVFAFSTENWKRPAEEVDYLMNLLVEYLHKELDELHRNNIKIRLLGDIGNIPRECQQEIEKAVEMTSGNSGMVFNLALNYGARKEIVDAAKRLGRQVQSGEIDPDAIDEEIFSRCLYTEGIPDPDLLIRTAGEMRISNFLLWQIAYAEIVVLETLWPDFNRDDLIKTILEYQKRDRRFGGLNK